MPSVIEKYLIQERLSREKDPASTDKWQENIARRTVMSQQNYYAPTDEDVYTTSREGANTFSTQELQDNLDRTIASSEPEPIPNAQPEIAIDSEESEKGFVETGLETLAWLTTPLTFLQAGAIAPMIHDYESETTIGRQLEGLKVSGQAMLGALFPSRGEEHPRYGEEIVSKHMEGLEPGAVRSLIEGSIDIFADPAIILSLGGQKLLQQGIQIAKATSIKRAAAGLAPLEEGVVTQGVKWMIGLDAIVPEEATKVQQLARQADTGDAKALKEVVEIVDDPEVIKKVKAATEQQGADFIEDFAKQVDPAGTIGPTVTMNVNKLLPSPGASITSNIPERSMNINMNKVNTTDDVKGVIDNVTTQFENDFKRLRVSGKLPAEEFTDAAQRQKWTDITGHDIGPLPAQKAYALRMMMVSSAENLERAALAYKRNPTPASKLRFDKSLTMQKVIQGEDIERAAEAGRTLQSYSLAAKSTPEKIREIQKIVREYDPDYGPESVSDAIANIKNPKGIVRFVDYIKNGFDTTTDAFYQFFIHSILSGPVTHAKNFISNTAMSLAQPVETAAAAVPAFIRGQSPEALTRLQEAGQMIYGMQEAFTDAFRISFKFNRYQAKELITNHQYPEELFNRSARMTSDSLQRGGQPAHIADNLDTVNTVTAKQLANEDKVGAWLPGDLLQRGDFFFKTINYRAGIRQQAVRKAASLPGGVAVNLEKALNKPHQLMKDNAIEFAKYTTFQTELGKSGDAFVTWVRATPGIRYVFPFVRTPVNLIKTGIERTPFAVYEPLWKGFKKGGGFNAETDVMFARAGLGTAAAAGALMAFDSDSLTGNWEPGTPKAKFMEAHGNPRYSIKFGNDWYSYEGIEPLRFVLGSIGNYMEVMDNLDLNYAPDIETADEVAAAYALAFLESAVDESYLTNLTGVTTVLRALAIGDTNSLEAFGIYGTKLGTSFIPNILNQLNKRIEVLDPVFRMSDNYIQRIMSRLPGISNKLPPHRDLFGEPAHIPSGLGPDIISPIQTRTESDNPIINEITRLRMDIPRLGRQVNGIELDSVRYSELQRLAGQGSEKYNLPSMETSLANYMNLGIYSGATDEGKKNILTVAINKNREGARGALKGEDPELVKSIYDLKRQQQQELTPGR